MSLHKIFEFKHWQLFIILCVPAFLSIPEPFDIIVDVISGVILWWWLYATGLYGQQRIKEQGIKPMNFVLFRANIVIGALTYIALIVLSYLDTNDNSDLLAPVNLPYLIGTIYIALAYLHIIIFCAKTLSKLEYNREVIPFEWIMNFILFFFPFVGVWFLQPRIKQLIA